MAVEAEDLAARLKAEFPHALRSGQVVAYYQPEVELSSGRLVAAESLARWEHPEFGTLPPALFTAVAGQLGRWASSPGSCCGCRWCSTGPGARSLGRPDLGQHRARRVTARGSCRHRRVPAHRAGARPDARAGGERADRDHRGQLSFSPSWPSSACGSPSTTSAPASPRRRASAAGRNALKLAVAGAPDRQQPELPDHRPHHHRPRPPAWCQGGGGRGGVRGGPVRAAGPRLRLRPGFPARPADGARRLRRLDARAGAPRGTCRRSRRASDRGSSGATRPALPCRTVATPGHRSVRGQTLATAVAIRVAYGLWQGYASAATSTTPGSGTWPSSCRTRPAGTAPGGCRGAPTSAAHHPGRRRCPSDLALPAR